ncbi:diguanylate cyclase (GGDEF) domain-containing protein [Beggiatoa alba B18LD]|uniref:diguanylate cyclase n=1 Tax=Beggiatoa alba B18LD TaxID=395493 RepID=I3CE53_9GAMM|nr:sensor domain-containing diguanylate cyclase [Beggiatoa alba]EIJ41896.1 diguanylate cyclase (GGDEF) domain-containing protein [Beggiatoa alba B18LD]
MELLIKHVLDTLAGLGHSERVALFSVQTAETGILAGGFNRGEFLPTGQIIHFTNTPLAEILETRKPATFNGILLDDILPFPSYSHQQTGFTCLCLPLISEESEGVIGIAVLAQEIGITQPDYQLQILGMLRTLIAAAMEKARLFQLATMDSLTGLYTRRYFDIRLHEEIVRLQRHGGDVSLILLDIDHFKRINDTYGHLHGDYILRGVAELLLNTTRRDIDIVSRYGGEEFIILLPHTGIEGAYVVAERIRQNCQDYPFKTPTEEACLITLSGGIATMNQVNLLNSEELIHRADLMLYAAKNSGRNQMMQYGLTSSL